MLIKMVKACDYLRCILIYCFTSPIDGSTNPLSVIYYPSIEQLKLLSKLEKAGLLSAVEKSGLTLSKIEKLGLLSTAENLGLLSAASDR